jgi:hypothetical protein
MDVVPERRSEHDDGRSLSKNVKMLSGDERFSVDDLYALSELVAGSWTSAAEHDWSVAAGTVEWSCTRTADHAVDCVYAPAFFLASRKRDAYPDVGLDLTIGPQADPARLVQSLEIATRILSAVVNDAGPDVRAVLFRRPEILTAAAEDFPPRAAVELILHAHDVCSGLRVPFEPPAGLCYRLREHTRPWPMWTVAWSGLGRTADPWGDLLTGSGRHRQSGTSLIS